MKYLGTHKFEGTTCHEKVHVGHMYKNEGRWEVGFGGYFLSSATAGEWELFVALEESINQTILYSKTYMTYIRDL